MSYLRVVRQGDLAELTELHKALSQPRTDIVAERVSEPDVFEASSGPFSSYERRLELRQLDNSNQQNPTDSNQNNPSSIPNNNTRKSSLDKPWELIETITYRLAIPMWAWLFHWPIRRALRHRRKSHSYWWAPPDRLNARQATVLGLLCTAQVVDGYLGTILTQTLTFAADEFGHDNTAQGILLGVVRAGVLLALLITTLADRHGRRRLLVVAGVVSCATTALGALSPALWVLGASQLVARGLSTALGILIVIMAAEEMPARCRAWAVSLLVLCAGLGAGMAVWLLPLADLHVRAWRIVYVIPVLGIAIIIWVGHKLPESLRFESALTRQSDTPPDVASPDVPLRTQHDPAKAKQIPERTRRRERMILLASAAFLLAMFAAPASGLQNDFLKDERGYSAAAITLFTLTTSTPSGIGVLVGGYLAERRGRRQVGAAGLMLGAGATAIAFFAAGPALWLLTLAGALLGGMAVPALAVYGPELFGTVTRGRANGLITNIGVAGSALGLLTVGWLSDELGGQIGPAVALTAVGPLAVAILVVTKFPESAGLELEELNPEDRP